MGLIILSAILSVVLGSCAWLGLGDRFPVGDDAKWPVANNICVYAAILLLPVYLTIFVVFSFS
jgi:hypothetical protein